MINADQQDSVTTYVAGSFNMFALISAALAPHCLDNIGLIHDHFYVSLIQLSKKMVF